jgi:ABC-type lipoprotein export system ATPase subunit
MLSIRNLSKCYRTSGGGVRALDGVSLDLRGGDLLAVAGPSGSGKSTLLLIAGGLLAPDGGQVLLDGKDVYALSAAERARLRAASIGFVFQQFHLIPYLSVLENVLAPSLAFPVPGSRRRARELIARFGCEERAHHVPAQLSAGERQRTALARALFNNPKLLLVDEPTGNLDDENARIVFRYLSEFAAAGGAVLLVTHDPSAVGFARRVLRLERGRLLGDGTSEGKAS